MIAVSLQYECSIAVLQYDCSVAACTRCCSMIAACCIMIAVLQDDSTIAVT